MTPQRPTPSLREGPKSKEGPGQYIERDKEVDQKKLEQATKLAKEASKEPEVEEIQTPGVQDESARIERIATAVLESKHQLTTRRSSLTLTLWA